MARQLKHDGFARFTLFKEYWKHTHETCTNCGNGPPSYAGIKLYKFYTVKDDSLAGVKNYCAGGKLFCCVSCMRQYVG